MNTIMQMKTQIQTKTQTQSSSTKRSSLMMTADAEELPLIQFINNLLVDAVQQGISDLHFEPYDNYYRLRIRQDGILYEISKLPLKLKDSLVSRLKIMSNLDISERRLPQDGRFNIDQAAQIDFRISTCPTLFGEKIVIRILDLKQSQFDIDNLGFEAHQKELLLSYLQKPQGMILVTGPTGSGKTLSLYTAVNLLNTEHCNILTCEDPIEIYLPGINQVNINVKAGLNFANALRAFLRQDPDIIMLGEIRDLETAEIAIKASQTGHLLLSTLHTNSATATINRLMHMGIPHFNLASSLSLIIAQRLARRLCQSCKIPYTLPGKILEPLGFATDKLDEILLFKPNGCVNCKNGYKGRIGIYELLAITPNIQRAILNHENTIELQRKAEQEGMWSLKKAAFNKVRGGITSLEEIQRVIMDTDFNDRKYGAEQENV